MMNKFYDFEYIYVENGVKAHPKTKHILDKLNNKNIIYIDNIHELIKNTPPVYHPKDRAKSLFLGSIRGEILQKCPGSHGHICCNYSVINLYVGCPINCSYCILQAYLNQPFTIINVNIEEIFNELNSVLSDNKDKIYRIGTGELGDSLVYDYLTDFSTDFIDFFSKYDNAIFEFKTKTDFIQNLLNHKGNHKNIVCGFSVNPQELIDKEEEFSASLSDRLRAAQKLIDSGYKIALHFDPVMNVPDFNELYKNLITEICKNLDLSKVSWVSIGTFRFTPDLKISIEYNYPKTDIIFKEFVKCKDEKFRYFRSEREAFYSFIINLLRKEKSDIPVYLCMESPEVWQKTIGDIPGNDKNLTTIFKKL